MDEPIFTFTTKEDVLATLARLTKKRRLEKGYSRISLQSVTGVPAPTIARFETTGKISLDSFVKIAMTLGYENELMNLLRKEKYSTMEEMESIKKNRNRQRGTRKC